MVTGHRPFTGRTLPELTQAIVGGPLRPPTALNPEVSPELERIILTAMARKREDRYENASLMAQELRNLHLHALSSASPASLTSPAVKLAARPPISPREGLAVRPPKRPQAQRPRYVDLEDTQPPLSAPQEPKEIKKTPEQPRSLSPQPTLSPRSPLPIIEQTDDVPTRPLTNGNPAPEEAQEMTSSEAQRQRWKQFQRFFKTPPEQKNKE